MPSAPPACAARSTTLFFPTPSCAGRTGPSFPLTRPSRAMEQLSARGIALGRVVGPGSLLVTCIAGSATSIGNVTITDRKVAFNQQINAVTPRTGVVPLFLYGLLLAAKPL